MENNVQKTVRDILTKIGKNICIEDIVIGSKVEVKVGAEGENYFLKVRTEKQVPGEDSKTIDLYYNENMGVDGMFPFNVADGISKGLVLEKYKTLVNIQYMKNEDKITLGIPIIP